MHELGELEVKHGAKVAIANVYTSELGNPQRLANLLEAHAAPESPPVSSAEKSIAVLAFVNMSNDPENEYFSDGIAEEIINTLTKVKPLRVASRTSSFAFKGKNEDIGGIERKLKVNTVFEGSVRKAGKMSNNRQCQHARARRLDRAGTPVRPTSKARTPRVKKRLSWIPRVPKRTLHALSP